MGNPVTGWFQRRRERKATKVLADQMRREVQVRCVNCGVSGDEHSVDVGRRTQVMLCARCYPMELLARAFYQPRKR